MARIVTLTEICASNNTTISAWAKNLNLDIAQSDKQQSVFYYDVYRNVVTLNSQHVSKQAGNTAVDEKLAEICSEEKTRQAMLKAYTQKIWYPLKDIIAGLVDCYVVSEVDFNVNFTQAQQGAYQGSIVCIATLHSANLKPVAGSSLPFAWPGGEIKCVIVFNPTSNNFEVLGFEFDNELVAELVLGKKNLTAENRYEILFALCQEQLKIILTQGLQEFSSVQAELEEIAQTITQLVQRKQLSQDAAFFILNAVRDLVTPPLTQAKEEQIFAVLTAHLPEKSNFLRQINLLLITALETNYKQYAVADYFAQLKQVAKSQQVYPEQCYQLLVAWRDILIDPENEKNWQNNQIKLDEIKSKPEPLKKLSNCYKKQEDEKNSMLEVYQKQKISHALAEIEQHSAENFTLELQQQLRPLLEFLTNVPLTAESYADLKFILSKFIAIFGNSAIAIKPDELADFYKRFAQLVRANAGQAEKPDKLLKLLQEISVQKFSRENINRMISDKVAQQALDSIIKQLTVLLTANDDSQKEWFFKLATQTTNLLHENNQNNRKAYYQLIAKFQTYQNQQKNSEKDDNLANLLKSLANFLPTLLQTQLLQRSDADNFRELVADIINQLSFLLQEGQEDGQEQYFFILNTASNFINEIMRPIDPKLTHNFLQAVLAFIKDKQASKFNETDFKQYSLDYLQQTIVAAGLGKSANDLFALISEISEKNPKKQCFLISYIVAHIIIASLQPDWGEDLTSIRKQIKKFHLPNATQQKLIEQIEKLIKLLNSVRAIKQKNNSFNLENDSKQQENPEIYKTLDQVKNGLIVAVAHSSAQAGDKVALQVNYIVDILATAETALLKAQLTTDQLCLLSRHLQAWLTKPKNFAQDVTPQLKITEVNHLSSLLDKLVIECAIDAMNKKQAKSVRGLHTLVLNKYSDNKTTVEKAIIQPNRQNLLAYFALTAAGKKNPSSQLIQKLEKVGDILAEKPLQTITAELEQYLQQQRQQLLQKTEKPRWVSAKYLLDAQEVVDKITEMRTANTISVFEAYIALAYTQEFLQGRQTQADYRKFIDNLAKKLALNSQQSTQGTEGSVVGVVRQRLSHFGKYTLGKTGLGFFVNKSLPERMRVLAADELAVTAQPPMTRQ